MIGIKDLFKEEELTETNNGNFKTVCPDCGLQGGRTEGFILFTESNRSFCHTSNKHFNLLETYALKKKLIKCIDGKETGEKGSSIPGELFFQTSELFKEEFSEEEYFEVLDYFGMKRKIELPGNGILISQFADKLASRLKKQNIFFYRGDTRRIVEIGKIKQADGNYFYNGFVEVEPNRFITLVEGHFIPWTTIYLKTGPICINKSMASSIASTVLVSDNFRDNMPIINRIFNVQIPIFIKEKNTIEMPLKGYDKRFNSWLPFNAPLTDNLDMTLEEAKTIINNLFKEFCFKSEQDKTNAIAGFITPYLRGLFSTFSIRTPVFIYEANRERAGKDYLAGLTGILYEGFALEEPPISTGDKIQNNSDELKKKILSAMIFGRKRLHFSNNKGYLNNATFESVTTAEKYSDRVLGRSEILTFNNELDFSLSGNIGMTLTPDLANRSRFVKLFLDIEDANSRTFEIPDLHGWLKDNRNLILSALYCLVKNWIVNGMKPGSIPFSSFSEWAKVCGGVMESADLGNPCVQDKDVSGIAVDEETSEMKTVFEICYSKKPGLWIKKQDIIDIVKEEEDFGYNFENKSDQVRFGIKVIKYVGRILSDIKLFARDTSNRASRWMFKFEKEKGIGHLGSIGKVVGLADEGVYIYTRANPDSPQTLPILPTLPTQQKPIQKSVSDREVQFFEAEECKSIIPNHTKEDILNWIKENKNGYTNFKIMYDKFGVGSRKFRDELKMEGLI